MSVWVAGALTVGAVGGIYSANKQASAAKDAAAVQSASADKGISAQTDASNRAIDVQQNQFDAIKKILSPYVNAGNQSLQAQQDLTGLNGNNAMQQAVDQIQNSPQFAAMSQQGENGILANASATGGLRGGNTEAALLQFRPQLLSQLIDQQYQRLGGLTSIGENAASGTGNAGLATGKEISSNILNTGSAISGLYKTQGNAAAGADLAQGKAYGEMANAVTGAFGNFVGNKF